MTREDEVRMTNIGEFYMNRSNIPDRGDQLPDERSHTYILMEKVKESSRTKSLFLKSIIKIGKTTISKQRHMSYNVIKNTHNRFEFNRGGSEDDVTYTENLTTRVFNLNNLNGSFYNSHKIHINENILSFEDQNWLAVYFFNQVYDQFLKI